MNTLEMAEALIQNSRIQFVPDTGVACPYWVARDAYGCIAKHWVTSKGVQTSGLSVVDTLGKWRKRDLLDVEASREGKAECTV